MADFNLARGGSPGWPLGEAWALGDSALVGLLLDEQWMSHHREPAPHVTPELRYDVRDPERTVRVYDEIDARFIIEDMHAKLQLAYG